MRLLLILLFIVVPIAELAVIIQVGGLIGVWPTIAILIADSVLGSVLMRSQGRVSWRRFNLAVQEGRPPAREVADGALIIFGGALLLTPGFLTDILGIALLLPPTRAIVRRLLVRTVAPPDGVLGRELHGARGRAAAVAADLRRRRHRHRRRPGAAPPVIDPELERPRAGAGASAAFADAVTFAFGDKDADLYGLARAGLSPDPERDDGRLGSALAVLFSGSGPLAALGRGRVELDAGADFADLALPGLRTTVEAPLERWRVELDAGDEHGSAGFSLTFEAIGGPAELAARRARRPRRRHAGLRAALPRAAAPCAARRPRAADRRARPARSLVGRAGLVADRAGAHARRVAGRRLRRDAHLGAPGRGPPATPTRQAWAALLGAGEGERVEEPRLSTTTDGEGRQRRAGLELWMAGDDGHARYAARRGRVRLDDRARRSCASTARSSAGTWRAARASGATTCCAAHERRRGRRHRLRRRADDRR